MLSAATTNPSAWSAAQWSSFRLGLFARTIGYNGLVAVIATLLAWPAAIVIGRGRGLLSTIILLLLPLAVLMPSLVYTYGWMQVFRLLRIEYEPAGAGDVARCIWTLACWLWALPAMAIGLVLRYSDSQVQQQAILDGALWRTMFRQLRGPIFGSMAIVLVLAMQEFAVYERSGISVMATEIRTVFETGSLGQSSSAIAAVTAGSGKDSPDQAGRAAAAVATALPMLLLVAGITTGGLLSIRRSASEAQIGVQDWPGVLDAGWKSKALTLAVICITAILPSVAMILSLARPLRPVRIWESLGPHVGGSILIGLASGVLALGVALLACIRRSPLLLLLAIATFLIGGELLGIANIRLYNRSAPWPDGVRVSGHDPLEWIYNSAAVMVIAYLGRFGWIALLAGELTWSRGMRDLRSMSALEGAGSWQTARSVIWPIALPMLAAAAVLVMILAMTEVPATVLLSPQRPQMLIPLLMSWVHMLRYDDMLEGSLLMMSLVLILGAGFVSLTWIGARLIGFVSRKQAQTISIILLAGILIVAGGCGDRSRPQAVWGQTGTGKVQTVYPRGICYSIIDDCFFVVDRMARVQRLDQEGHWLNEWRMPEHLKGKPVGLSVGPDGNVYVADTHYARVMVFTPEGQRLREWGSEGTGPGQFIYPTDVAFDSKGNIFVSEYGDHDRIQVFDGQGNYLREFGRFGDKDGEFSRPQSILIDGDLLYVADSCNHRIAVFRTDGSFVRNMGQVGSALGEFRFPYGLDQDSTGHLIVAEFGNNRVQMIDKVTGKGIRSWGVAGREPGQLAYPWAVAVDKRDRVVVVDSGNNRMQVFAE